MINLITALFNLTNGKKTYAGAILYALGGFASIIGHPEIGAPLQDLGTALSVIGVGHKIDKAANGETVG